MVMHNYSVHRMSETKEGYIPSHRHQKPPDSGQRDRTTDMVYKFLKDYPTKVATTALEACTPEKNKDDITEAQAANKKCQDLKCPRVQLLNGTVVTNRNRHRLSITKEYMLEKYHNVFSGVGTLPGKEYHITLKRNYVPVQHPLEQSWSGSTQCTKRASMTTPPRSC